MIIRFQKIRGIRLFRWGKTQAELWLAPGGETLPMHTHTHCSSRIIYLLGKMTFWFGPHSCDLSMRSFLKNFVIPAGAPHGGQVTGRFVLFINFERWNSTPTSAAHDFIRA